MRKKKNLSRRSLFLSDLVSINISFEHFLVFSDYAFVDPVFFIKFSAELGYMALLHKHSFCHAPHHVEYINIIFTDEFVNLVLGHAVQQEIGVRDHRVWGLFMEQKSELSKA